jgi:hypothetical protein
MLVMNVFAMSTHGWNNSKKRGGQGINRGVGKIRPTLVAMIKIHLKSAL